MAFETLDLGRIIATAEGIKGMKRQAETDKLRDAYLNTQMQGAQQQQKFAAQDQQTQMDEKTARQHFLANQAIETSADPKAAVMQFAPEIPQQYDQAHGPGSFEQLHPEDIKSLARFAKEKAAAAAGINTQPDANVVAQQQFALQRDQQNFGQQKELAGMQYGQQKQLAGVQHGYRLEEIGATNATKPGRAFRPLTAEEVAQAGLPAGTSAQIDETTGKVDVLSKRDATSTLSQKDMTTAKMKLNTVALARQQLNAIKQSFGEGTKGINAFGPVQGHLPTQAGHSFDRRVDQMRSTLTALTRVPGVGAMSDYETKLDQAKFPSRSEYEKVTKDQIDDLERTLNTIERGYTDLLSGSASGTSEGAAPAAGGWTVKKVK